MSLAAADRELIVEELGREPTTEEAALFENLWSEHCAYRSSKPLLSAFESEGAHVVIGPGDDAAVVALPSDDESYYITFGIESHNHPSYVDPFDGAATGVGGIVRDTLSMGAYPIALADSLYFGPFDREHTKYLFEGVVEGIGHYGNCIGVPTVAGSVDFHEGYIGNPLVNVACIGLLPADRLVTATAQQPGNALVLVGNATGRDGLGGASFASEDLAEDAETEDRPAVQVGDPYAEKRLIEANEELLDGGLIESARDLGAAGLGGASSEMVAKGGLGADIDLGAVHQREPNMRPLEILLAESQERMCYEVAPGNVDDLRAIAKKFDLGCSVIGEVTADRYVCTFDGKVVVDVDAVFLGEGAPPNDLPATEPSRPPVDRPDVELERAMETVLSSPNTASKRWVYRQYDHEVGLRTIVPPGDDAAVLDIREIDTGLALSSGAAPNWTSAAPYAGAQAVALENATNLATKGATPLAAVDCLNGGNPETPAVYGGFSAIVEGLADMCSALSVPVVGGNVSLYNDSAAGPIPPTPTLAMVGTTDGSAPPAALAPEGGEIVLVGADSPPALGGSELLAQVGGSDRFPALPERPGDLIETLASIATEPSTLAVHDISHGGLAVTLAELITDETGIEVDLEADDVLGTLFGERPGRVVVQTDDLEALNAVVGETTSVTSLGTVIDDPYLDIRTPEKTMTREYEAITTTRSVIESTLE